MRWSIAQAAEIRWWQKYLKNKQPAVYLEWKKSYWRGFCADCGLDTSTFGACLDAGSSLAGIFTILTTQACVAIDPLMQEYARLLPDFFNPSWYPNTDFRAMRLEALAEHEVYDTVFCINVINHVQDIRLVINNLWASLKPNGRLVLSVDTHNWAFFRHLFRILPLDILHPHQYYLPEYVGMISEICQTSPDAVRVVHLKKAFFFDYYALIITKR